MHLSSNQIKQYEQDGYVAPIDVLSKEEANEIRDEIEYIEKKWPEELELSLIHISEPTRPY